MEVKAFVEDADKRYVKREELTTYVTREDLTAAEQRSDRLVRERTARPPAGLIAAGTELEARSLGDRFIESAEFKSLNGMEGRTSRGVLALHARVHTPSEFRAITIAGSGVTIQPRQLDTLRPPRLPLVMRDLVPVIPLSGTNAVQYMIETWTYNADYQVAEGDKKAEGAVAFTDASVMVRTIAWFVKVSRQMMADAPWFAATINEQMSYGILKKEDHEILWGNNAAGHLHGLMPQAPALPAGVLTGGTTNIDLVLSAIAYLSNLGFPPDGIVMNPMDWAQMQLTKSTTDNYILGGPPNAISPMNLWGIPLVLTQEMTAGNMLVGSFRLNCALFDREAISVEIAYENEDDFVRNMVTIRAEERIAFVVYRPQAFVKATLAAPAGVAAQQSGNKK